MSKTCTVPVNIYTNDDNEPVYLECGLDAAYRVGNWYVCEKHKKYYTDPNNWEAVKLEE